ncbi:hypothetical protein [Bradyrhizobium cenepequi]
MNKQALASMKVGSMLINTAPRRHRRYRCRHRQPEERCGPGIFRHGRLRGRGDAGPFRIGPRPSSRTMSSNG